MPWFNGWGLLIMTLIMVPNLLFALFRWEGFENRWSNRAVEIAEQVGRFGCFGLMVIQIPGTCFGWWFPGALTVYLTVNGVLVALYELLWALCFGKNSLFRALALSILPSVLFLFCGVMTRSVLLVAAALLFAPCHILISYKNAR